MRTKGRSATLALVLAPALCACDQLEKLKNKGGDATAADAAPALATAPTAAPVAPAATDTATAPPVTTAVPLGGGAPAPAVPGVRPVAADGGAPRLDAGVAGVDAGAVRATDGGVAPVPTPGGMKLPPFPFDAGAFTPPPGFTIPTAIPTTLPTFPPPAK